MAFSQRERTKRYFEKHGIRRKTFSLDVEMLNLFEALAEHTQQSQITVLRVAMKDYAQKVGLKMNEEQS